MIDSETHTAAAPGPALPLSQFGPLDDARFAPGRIFASRYRIVSLLGRGAMGEVYRAEDLKLGQPVALKLMVSKARRHDDFPRFVREVRLARTIAHPNVCRVYDLADAEGWQYLSMEYVDGETLALLSRRIGRLPPDRALDFARQLFAGVAAAHDRGVLHRDLKPSNIMVDGRGRIRILDFGLAVSATESSAREFAGTPAYMAPEQLAGDPVTERTDLYALGLVLYELCAGRPLFAGEALVDRVRQSRCVTPRELSSDIHPSLASVVAECLAEEPSSRPPSASSVLAVLPGGDPLTAAVAEGRVPSPDMVAAADKKGALALPVAWGLLSAVAISLAAVASRADVLTVSPSALPKPPQVLAERCREILLSVGHDSAAMDHDFWFGVAGDQTVPAALIFVYRQSPGHLVARNLFRVVSETDPPANEPGMATVRVDASGRLAGFSRIPDQRRRRSADVRAVNWAALFAEAGLDAQHFVEVEVDTLPLIPYDRTHTWERRSSDSAALRVTAATLDDSPVYFEIANVAATSMRDRPVLTSGRSPAVDTVLWLFVVSAFVVMGVMARRNLRAGEGDLSAAKKLVVFVVTSGVVNALLRAHYIPLAIEETVFLLGVTGWALVWAGFSWLAYLSFEPYVRRVWPRTLIAWTRLLAGQVRDPLVGRDVLAGTLAGVVLAGILVLQVTLAGHETQKPPFDPAIESLASSRLLAWSLTFGVLDALQFALGGLFFLLLVRMVVRNDWLAILVAGILAAPLAPAGAAGIVGATSAGAFYAIVATMITRVGLLAGVVTLTTERLLTHSPLTLDVYAWYFGSSMLILLLVMTLAIYGFVVSLAGRPAFGVKER